MAQNLLLLGTYSVFVINLRTRPKRLEQLTKRLLDPYFRGVSVEVLHAEPHPIGRIGCFESHKQIWKEVVDRGLDVALVLEDDCDASFFLSEDLLTEILTEAAGLPEWDLFYLGYCVQPGLLAAPRVAKHAVSQKVWYTHAYLIRRNGCLKLLDAATPDQMESVDVDDFLKDQEGLRTYCAVPMLFRQSGDSASDIDPTRRDIRRFNAPSEIKHYVYRAIQTNAEIATWLKYLLGRAAESKAIFALLLGCILLLSAAFVSAFFLRQS